MIFSVVQKMFWLLLICAFSRAFPHINVHTKEETKIVFENSLGMTKSNRPEITGRPNSQLRFSSLIFPDDRIYFPDRRKEMAPIRYERRRLTSLRFEPPRYSFFQNRMIQRSQYSGRSDASNPNNPTYKLRSADTGVKTAERVDNGQDMLIFPHPEQVKKSNENEPTISWFERWLNRKKQFFEELQTRNTSTSGEDGNDDPNIAFQSLFRLPTLKTKTKPKPCPPNERKNHYGDCVQSHPIKIVLLEDSKS